MAALEKRIAELDSLTAGDYLPLKVVFRKEGQTIEQARIEVGMQPDYDRWRGT